MTDDTTSLSDDAPEPARRSKRRWLLWGALAGVLLVVLAISGYVFWRVVINDQPDAFDRDDLTELVEGSVDTPPADTAESPTTTDADQSTTTATTETASTESDTTPTTAVLEASAVDGAWVVTDASELGYRIVENLFGVDAEAVGRTNQVSGGMTIAGTTVTDANFEVDMATVESDDGRRDNQFRGRIMTVDEFPTSSFVLTAPIELGAIPAEGEQITVSATGDLTLRGVTNSVTFDVIAQFDADSIGVLGQIPVVFEDYGIANPSTAGVQTEDEGLLEFVLVFGR